MPTIVIPIRQTIEDRPSSVRIRRLMSPVVEGFRVETVTGRWAPVSRCRTDTAASYTLMSATLARSLGVPFPAEKSVLNQTTAGGGRTVRVHDGELRVRFPQLPDHTFRLYCLFVEETPPTVPVLIGLHDTLELFRLTFDGRPGPAAPVGRIVMETV